MTHKNELSSGKSVSFLHARATCDICWLSFFICLHSLSSAFRWFLFVTFDACRSWTACAWRYLFMCRESFYRLAHWFISGWEFYVYPFCVAFYFRSFFNWRQKNCQKWTVVSLRHRQNSERGSEKDQEWFDLFVFALARQKKETKTASEKITVTVINI